MRLTGVKTSARAATPRAMGRPNADLPGVTAHQLPGPRRVKVVYTPRDFAGPKGNRNPVAYNGAALERAKTHLGHPARGYGA